MSKEERIGLVSSHQLDFIKEEINLIQNSSKQPRPSKTSPFQLFQTQENDLEEQIQTGFNSYADKQLLHLVIVEQFNFTKISQILRVVFRHDRMDMSEQNCRERWLQIHRNRKKGQQKQKRMQDKRIKSILAFSNPYSLYDVEQLIETLEKNEKTGEEREKDESVGKYEGYNILKDNFREIKDWDQYRKRQNQMKQALMKASTEKYEEKPLIFQPNFDKINNFQVSQEQLTPDKAKKLMTYQIQMQRVSRQLTHEQDLVESSKYEQIIKKRIEIENREHQQYDLEENWDEYESD